MHNTYESAIFSKCLARSIKDGVPPFSLTMLAASMKISPTTGSGNEVVSMFIYPLKKNYLI